MFGAGRFSFCIFVFFATLLHFRPSFRNCFLLCTPIPFFPSVRVCSGRLDFKDQFFYRPIGILFPYFYAYFGGCFLLLLLQFVIPTIAVLYFCSFARLFPSVLTGGGHVEVA